MIDAPLALAFTAGLVAAINPCGFAMLPAYLAYFLGLEGERNDEVASSLGRAVITSASLSVGFLLVLGAIGGLLNAGVEGIRDVLPWVNIVIGVGLIILGGAMLGGFKPTVALPRLQRGGGDRSIGSMVLFGASYATVSLSCTLVLFLSVVVNQPRGFASGMAAVLAYGMGMAITVTALTMSLALARSSLLGLIRRSLKYVDRVAGALLVVTGVYTVAYWINDLTAEVGSQPGPIRWVERRSAELNQWVQDTGGLRIGLLLTMVIAAVVLVALMRPTPTRSASDGDRAAR